MKKRTKARLEVFLEFLIFGVAMGLVEDLIALKLVADTPITLNVVLIVIAVVIPFAIIGELIVDRLNLLPNNKHK